LLVGGQAQPQALSAKPIEVADMTNSEPERKCKEKEREVLSLCEKESGLGEMLFEKVSGTLPFPLFPTNKPRYDSPKPLLLFVLERLEQQSFDARIGIGYSELGLRQAIYGNNRHFVWISDLGGVAVNDNDMACLRYSLAARRTCFLMLERCKITTLRTFCW